MSKELDRIKKLAQGVGIDIDVVLGEIANEVARKLPKQPAEADWQKMVEDVSMKVEARVGAKLADVLQAVKASADGSKPDTEGIIKGVANLLQPQIVEAARQASETVFKANSQALFQQLEEKLKQGAGVTTSEQTIGNMSAGGLLQALLANSDGIAKLIAAFRPQSTDAKIAEQLTTVFKWHSLLSKLESGKANIDELQSNITQITAPKPQP